MTPIANASSLVDKRSGSQSLLRNARSANRRGSRSLRAAPRVRRRADLGQSKVGEHVALIGTRPHGIADECLEREKAR